MGGFFMSVQSFRIELGKENRVIRGDLFLPSANGRHPVVIICHGFKGFKDWSFFPVIGKHLANHGIAAITFNFSMNGIGEDLETFTELEKFAHLTFSREQEDLSVLLSQLKQGHLPGSEQIDRERIGILGHSRGGGNSLIFALDHPDIRAVAILNSIHRPDFFAPEVIAEIKQKGIGYITNARTKQQLPIDREVLDDIEANKERYYFMDRLPKLKQPLLIIQGDQDIPGFLEGAKQMAKLAPHASMHIIQGANHTFGSVHPFAGVSPQLQEALNLTTDFFRDQL
jgi:pimeloyl-ACP methyl ester carboxylesterase